jgi:2-keto-4-pentenoate hydratase/2-oxohepta-3-ene-1,7-dioic acid hydratase in catechol pathway
MTVRGPEERSFRKSVDSFAVVGPWVVTADELTDPSALAIELSVNGEPRQRANTRDLIVDVPGLIEMASRFYALLPGDIILTGTPAGVGPVVPGDVIVASIEGIGSMRVQVHGAEVAA